tara:strand:+ start:1291 stop:1443 length:153 start_codon:yes stop_codon:yes gene_type:complete
MKKMLKQKEKFWHNCAVDDCIDVAQETIESFVGCDQIADEVRIELEKLKN